MRIISHESKNKQFKKNWKTWSLGALDVCRLLIAQRPAGLAYDSMHALHLVEHSWLEHREDSSRHFKGMNTLTMALCNRLNNVETLYKKELESGKTTHVFRK